MNGWLMDDEWWWMGDEWLINGDEWWWMVMNGWLMVMNGDAWWWMFVNGDEWMMWAKQCHKPTMTGSGKHTTYKNGDDWGMVYGIVVPCFTHRVGKQWCFFCRGFTILVRKTRFSEDFAGDFTDFSIFTISQAGFCSAGPYSRLASETPQMIPETHHK